MLKLLPNNYTNFYKKTGAGTSTYACVEDCMKDVIKRSYMTICKRIAVLEECSL